MNNETKKTSRIEETEEVTQDPKLKEKKEELIDEKTEKIESETLHEEHTERTVKPDDNDLNEK